MTTIRSILTISILLCLVNLNFVRSRTLNEKYRRRTRQLVSVCEKNENFSDCPPPRIECEPHCPLSRVPRAAVCSTNECGSPRCVCDAEFLRNSTDHCVSKGDCYPKSSKKLENLLSCWENEEYSDCGPTHSCEITCENLNTPPNCPPIPEEQCFSRCVCEPGFVRNSEKMCVSIEDCPSKKGSTASMVCPDNSHFTDCGPPSDNCERSCENVGKHKTCVKMCGPPKCVCDEGYIRHSDGSCVRENNCGMMEGVISESETEPEPEHKSKEASPEGEAEPTPEGEAEPTPEGEAVPTPEGEAEPTPDGEAEPTLEGEAEPTPEGEAEHTPEGEAEPTPEGEAEPTPEGEAEPRPEGEAEITPEGEAEHTPEGEAEPTPEGEAEPRPEGEAEPTPEGEAEPRPEGEAEITPEIEAEPTPEGEAEPTPEGEAEPTPEGEAEPTPEGEAEPRPEGEAEPTSKGGAEPKPEGEAEPKPEGEAEPTPEGEAEPTSKGGAEPKPEGEDEPKPEGEAEPTPEGEAEPTPEEEAEEREKDSQEPTPPDSDEQPPKLDVITECSFAYMVTGGESTGVFSSPNYPDNYPPNGHCKYEFFIESNQIVTVEWNSFEIKAEEGCASGDYIEVHRQQEEANSSERYCESAPVITADTEYLAIEFHSDGENQAQGYEAKYSFKIVQKDICKIPKDLGEADCTNEPEVRWYFDETHMECLAFKYSGCGGNGNSFKTSRLCSDRCKMADGSNCAANSAPAVNEEGKSIICEDDSVCPDGYKCSRGAFFASCCDREVEETYSRNYRPVCFGWFELVTDKSISEFQMPLLGTSCADDFCHDDDICHQMEYFAYCCSPKEIPQCAENEQFNECASSCEASCSTEPLICTADCRPAACQCKQGYVRHEGKCIEIKECPADSEGSTGETESNEIGDIEITKVVGKEADSDKDSDVDGGTESDSETDIGPMVDEEADENYKKEIPEKTETDQAEEPSDDHEEQIEDSGLDEKTDEEEDDSEPEPEPEPPSGSVVDEEADENYEKESSEKVESDQAEEPSDDPEERIEDSGLDEKTDEEEDDSEPEPEPPSGSVVDEETDVDDEATPQDVSHNEIRDDEDPEEKVQTDSKYDDDDEVEDDSEPEPEPEPPSGSVVDEEADENYEKESSEEVESDQAEEPSDDPEERIEASGLDEKTDEEEDDSEPEPEPPSGSVVDEETDVDDEATPLDVSHNEIKYDEDPKEKVQTDSKVEDEDDDEEYDDAGEATESGSFPGSSVDEEIDSENLVDSKDEQEGKSDASVDPEERIELIIEDQFDNSEVETEEEVEPEAASGSAVDEETDLGNELKMEETAKTEIDEGESKDPEERIKAENHDEGSDEDESENEEVEDQHLSGMPVDEELDTDISAEHIPEGEMVKKEGDHSKDHEEKIQAENYWIGTVDKEFELVESDHDSGLETRSVGEPPEGMMKCGENELPNACGNVCEYTCENYDLPMPCPEICAPPACQCIKRFVRHEGLCIKADHCEKKCDLPCMEGCYPVYKSDGCTRCVCRVSVDYPEGQNSPCDETMCPGHCSVTISPETGCQICQCTEGDNQKAVYTIRLPIVSPLESLTYLCIDYPTGTNITLFDSTTAGKLTASITLVSRGIRQWATLSNFQWSHPNSESSEQAWQSVEDVEFVSISSKAMPQCPCDGKDTGIMLQDLQWDCPGLNCDWGGGEIGNLTNLLSAAILQTPSTAEHLQTMELMLEHENDEERRIIEVNFVHRENPVSKESYQCYKVDISSLFEDPALKLWRNFLFRIMF